LHALRSMTRAEGARGLTAGVLPTLLRDVPFSGIYLMFYVRLKQAALSSGGSAPLANREAVHFVCGLLAGALASLVTQPADVVKTRMQLLQAKCIN
jgi:solute carrier family 25, member 38